MLGIEHITMGQVHIKAECWGGNRVNPADAGVCIGGLLVANLGQMVVVCEELECDTSDRLVSEYQVLVMGHAGDLAVCGNVAD